LLICIAQTGLIASASAWIALSYPFLLVTFYVVLRFYLRTSRQLRHLDLEEKAPVYAQFLETLEGLTTIRAFSWTQDSLSQNYDLIDRSQKPFYLMGMIQKWLALVLDLIIMVMAVLVVGIAVALRNTISPGFTGVSLTQIISFTSYITTMILFWAQMETSIAAVARIRDFSKETESESSPEEDFDVPHDWPTSGKIEICNLSAKYRPEKESTVLNDINISISAGEKVCICGRTGSGKSSLVLALLRLLDPSSGTITIDNINITSLPHDYIRAHIIAVAEEAFFFPGTIRDNLDPYGDYDNDSIVEALTDVGLWTVVMEKGGLDVALEKEMLSHGQRQLFSIARAVARRHVGKLVLLDEITSSLDKHSEAIVNQIIQTRFADHTVLSVAHKLDFALGFDRVIVMDQGKVVEYDEPGALLARSSVFKELYEAQRLEEGPVE